MTDRITAQEAYSIASVDYERQMNKSVKDHLAKIYARIRNASQNGKMTDNVPITICVNEYKDKLSDLLKQDGLSVVIIIMSLRVAIISAFPGII